MPQELYSLPEIEKFEIEPKTQGDIEPAKQGIAYTGSPRKHPYREDKIVLIQDPLSLNSTFIEFYKKDIIKVEEISNIVTPSGKIIKQVRLWIKKGATGIKYCPFVVEDTHQALLEVFK